MDFATSSSTVLFKQVNNGRVCDDSLDCKSCKQFRCKRASQGARRPATLRAVLARAVLVPHLFFCLRNNGSRREAAFAALGFRARWPHIGVHSNQHASPPSLDGQFKHQASSICQRERVAFASFRAFAFTWAFFVLRSDCTAQVRGIRNRIIFRSFQQRPAQPPRSLPANHPCLTWDYRILHLIYFCTSAPPAERIAHLLRSQ